MSEINLDKQSLIKGEVEDDVQRKLLELSTLFEMSQLLNSSLNLNSIVDNILLSPMGRMMINKGLFLLHRAEQNFEILTLKGLSRDLLEKKIVLTDLPQKPFLIQEVAGKDWLPFFESQGLVLFVPIILRNDTIGLVVFGKKLIGGKYLESEIEFLNSLAHIAASSIHNGVVFEELRTVNQKLDKKIQELNTLFDIGKALNASLDSAKILKLLSYGLMGELMAQKFMIFIRRSKTVDIAENRGFAGVVVDEELISAAFSYSHPYSIDQSVNDFHPKLMEIDIIAVVPMRAQDTTKGVLLLGKKFNDKSYSRDELDFIHTLGNQAMISLENAWLFEDSLERKRLEEELAVARSIQIQLLPKKFPILETFDIFGLNISSKQVGGDYFDVIRLDDERYVIAIADVSGKGVPASLLMSNMQACLLALSPEISEFDKLVGKVNNIIHANTTSDKFVTFFGGVLNAKTREFKYVNAGHNPPYWQRSDGSLQTLDKGGLILGLMPDIVYEFEVITLSPGERIVMFTDGVTEAMNSKDEQFEELRLENLLKENVNFSAKELSEFLADRVKEFAGDTSQFDDITMVVIRAT